MNVITNKTKKRAPGPSFIKLANVSFAMKNDILSLFSNLHNLYGDIVRLPTPRLPVHIYFHPEHIRHFLKSNAVNYRKSDTFRELKPFLGEGLLTSEGDKWRQQRKTIAPDFHMKSASSFAEDTISFTTKLIQEWKRSSISEEVRDLSLDMMKLTFTIAGKSFFGGELISDADWVSSSLAELMYYSNRRMMKMIRLPRWIPTPNNRSAKKAISDIKNVVNKIIDIRIKNNQKSDDAAPFNDLLSRLLSTKMDRQELNDMVITLLVAGHETTSNALAWTWYLLAKNPNIANRLKSELAEILKGREPTFDDYPKLEYTRKVFLEALRLYPPGAVLTRNALSSDEIGGFAIPAKSMVICCPWVTHRHSAFWEVPEQFDPDRFSTENIKSRNTFAYLPFGGGPRECVGRNFAMLQGVLVIASLGQHFRIELVDDANIIPKLHIILQPENGIKARICKD